MLILKGAGTAFKSANLTKKLGVVGKHATRLVGYSVINTPQSIEKAAELLATSSPEALAINPIMQAAVVSEVECVKGLKQIGIEAKNLRN